MCNDARTLRGVGDAVYPAFVGVVTAWLVTPPLAAALGLGLGWGAAGGWLGLTLEIFVGAAILWRRLAREDWRAPALATRARTIAVAASVGAGEPDGDRDAEPARAAAIVGPA